MTQADQPGLPRTQRSRLAAELRLLRRLSGLSGRELRDYIKVSQAQISRIESGQSVPSVPQVLAWADATGASDDVRANLPALTEAALNEVDAWRAHGTVHPAAIQRDIGALEASAAISRHFQPAIVPGLLQTAEYARRTFEITDVGGWGDHAAAVAARMDRQQALYRPGKRFEFLLTEAAVRLRVGPPQVMRGQLRHLASLLSLENVDIGVVPLAAEASAVPWCPFHIYDELPEGQDPFVTIELPHGRLTVSDPQDVEIYQRQLEAIRDAAVHGEEARILLEGIE